LRGASHSAKFKDGEGMRRSKSIVVRKKKKYIYKFN
jgi:hypothetical protein